jgi:hypothetical protein
VHELQQAQNDGVAPETNLFHGTFLTVLFLQFGCDQGVKVELDITLVVGKPGGRDDTPG